MTTTRTILLVAAAALAAPGCGGCDGPNDNPDAGIDAASWDQCDGSPEAFVRQATLGLLGRRPLGQAEVDVYVDLYEAAQASGQDPRAVVARALMRAPGFVDRWVELVADALAVQRIDIQGQAACWGPANRSGPADPALAMAVRDRVATGGGDGRTFTMLDLARSSIALDDLTPVLRGQVFAMVNLPIPAANVPPIEAELAQRADFGATFDSAYLHRDLVCLGCHNSDGSVTDADDPALDRHWPVPGSPEKAVYGMANGIEPDRAHAVFRVDNFVGGFTRPWGWDGDCGAFSTSVADDPAGIDGKFASITGRRSTAFDLDGALRRGFEALRGVDPPLSADIADPDTALAWLVALAVVEDLWREVVGTRLTIANYFPRNEASSLELQRLATTFTKSGYSLEAVLTDIVSSDYFNRLPPESGCGGGPYQYPNVYDPWVISEADPARRLNGAGDAVAPVGARTLMSAADGALEWPPMAAARFPDLGEAGCEELTCSEANQYCDFGGFCCQTADILCAGGRPPVSLERGIGVYLRNSEHGFRGLDFQARLTWEERYGACAAPAGTSTDFIDNLIAAGGADTTATVEDVVVALKDRVIGEPAVIDDAERGALATLLGGALDRPASAVTEAQVRKLCGVLLSTPQFLLQGIAGRGGTRPKLTPANASYDAVCTALSQRDIGLTGFAVSCTPDGLTLVPARIAPTKRRPREVLVPALGKPSKGIARQRKPTRMH